MSDRVDGRPAWTSMSTCSWLLRIGNQRAVGVADRHPDATRPRWRGLEMQPTPQVNPLEPFSLRIGVDTE